MLLIKCCVNKKGKKIAWISLWSQKLFKFFWEVTGICITALRSNGIRKRMEVNRTLTSPE